jgi:type IX secretion system PorP/SprF family membrane protein
MKRLLAIACFFTALLPAGAQFSPVTSQYMFNGLVINPAYAGAMDAFVISGSHRAQWTGMPGAPQTQNFSVHGPLRKKKVAIGLMFFRDKIGVTSQNGVYAQYAYRVRMRKSSLAFGLSAGASFVRSAWNEVATTTQNDPSFTQAPMGYVLPNASFGMYFNNPHFFAGLSLPFFLQHPQLTAGGLQQVRNDISQYNPHLLAGGYIDAGPNLVLKPSVLVKSRLDDYIQADLNFMAMLYNRVGLGFSYRTSDAWVFPVQYNVNDQLTLSYAYDMGISALRTYHNGSHEIFIRYCFLYKKNVASSRSF